MKTIKSFLLRPTIPVFFVRQRIREDIFKTVRLFLSDRALSRAKAIAVVVDSKGGDMAQTEMLAKKLKMIGAKHHIPIYGFIEGSCVGQPYFMLSAAATNIYATKSSLIGFNNDTYLLNASRAIRNAFGVQTRTVTSTEGLTIDVVSAFEDNPNKDKLSQFHDKVRKQLFDWSLAFRQPKLKSKEIGIEDIYTAQQAEKIGLIDGYGTYQAFLSNKYPDCHIRPIHHAAFIERIRRKTKILFSPAIMIIILFLLIKAMAKYTFIVYVWARTKAEGTDSTKQLEKKK